MGMFTKGVEVLRCTPFSYTVRGDILPNVCDFCLQTTFENAGSSFNVKKCTGCKKLYYCGKNCLKKAWKSYHSKECGFLKDVSEEDLEDLDMERMIVRTILRLQNDGKEVFDELPNGKRRYFKDLMSHKEDIENDTTTLKEFGETYSILQTWMKDHLPSKSEVLEIYGKIKVNAHVISDTCPFDLGPGLFLGISAIDHSCAPNAVYISHGKNLIVRTIAEKIEDFSDIRLSYYRDLRHTTEVRRQSLLQTHYFLCECSNCMDVEKNELKTSMVCKNCEGCVPAVSGICCDCKTQLLLMPRNRKMYSA